MRFLFASDGLQREKHRFGIHAYFSSMILYNLL